MSKAVLTQTGTVNQALLPEDETHTNGHHAPEGVAYLLKKDISDLEVIEILPSVGAFHKARDCAGFYLVNMKDMSCSCPGYRFRGVCRHIRHVEEKAMEEAGMRKPTTKGATPKLPKGCTPMTDEQLAARKAKLDARNRELAKERARKRAVKKPTQAHKPFRPINPDEIEVTA